MSIIKNMALEEKCAFLSGKSVWETWDFPQHGIPPAWFADGPHGLRRQTGSADHLGLNASEPATCFPVAATVANSWDPALATALGEALGEEAVLQKVNVILGPGLNIKRSPLGGRNFEYFSEDPYLSGKMAAAYVSGIQKTGVSACPKHFAVNSQELRRMASNSVLDERTLREIYLTAFEIVVKESKPLSIMSSYNEVNGEYANENPHLLEEVLRDGWGFEGAVITDWGGSNDHVNGVKHGSTLEMPSPGLDSARQLLQALADGLISEEAIDRRVQELLKLILHTTGAMDGASFGSCRDAHHALARKAAAESAVLLKNEDETLPLEEGKSIAVIGDFAITPRYQGAGSSMVNPERLETFAEAIQSSTLTLEGIEPGFRRDGARDEELKKRAVELAARADIALLFLGLDELSECEGKDRVHMKLAENQQELLRAIRAVNPQAVICLSAGSPIEMPWLEEAKALVHGYLGGQAGAGGLLDVLSGKVNPSGKLAETLPLRLEDTPAYRWFPSADRDAEYRESIYVGYRYYDTAGIPVCFPFGYGLSYTSFQYSDLAVDEDKVQLVVTNTGSRDGAETVQIYIGKENPSVFRAKKELKGFQKVFLKAGESKKITVLLDDKAFRYWNVETGKWEEEPGDYHIMAGASIQDIRLQKALTLARSEAPGPYAGEGLPSYASGLVQQVSDEEFQALLGGRSHDGPVSPSPYIGAGDPISCMKEAKNPLARLVYRHIKKRIRNSEQTGKPDMNLLFIFNMPFRGIAKMTNGLVSSEMVEGLVQIVNGHFFRGLGVVVSGYFRNSRENKHMKERLSAAGK
jgi:beta-glucosidase